MHDADRFQSSAILHGGQPQQGEPGTVLAPLPAQLVRQHDIAGGRIREEGYRRPQDALLSVQGVRPEDHEPEHKVYGVGHKTSEERPFAVAWSDARAEHDQVEKLYKVLTEAKKRAGEVVSGNIDSFMTFVQKKTSQIQKQYKCEKVEYTVEVQDGHVKLKAKAKV